MFVASDKANLSLLTTIMRLLIYFDTITYMYDKLPNVNYPCLFKRPSLTLTAIYCRI